MIKIKSSYKLDSIKSLIGWFESKWCKVHRHFRARGGEEQDTGEYALHSNEPRTSILVVFECIPLISNILYPLYVFEKIGSGQSWSSEVLAVLHKDTLVCCFSRERFHPAFIESKDTVCCLYLSCFFMTRLISCTCMRMSLRIALQLEPEECSTTTPSMNEYYWTWE